MNTVETIFQLGLMKIIRKGERKKDYLACEKKDYNSFSYVKAISKLSSFIVVFNNADKMQVNKIANA